MVSKNLFLLSLILIGMALIFFIHFLVYYLRFRQSTEYLYLSIALFAFILMSLMGIKWLPVDVHLIIKLYFVSYFAFLLFIMLFCQEYFSIHRHKGWLIGTILLLILLILFVFIILGLFAFILYSVLTLFICGYLSYISIRAIRKGIKVAKAFLIGFIIMIVFSILRSAFSEIWLYIPDVPYEAYIMAAIFIIIQFNNQSLIMVKLVKSSDRLEQLNKELSHAYQTVEEQNRNLEEHVEERTQELILKNEELEDTLNELKAMQNKVIMQEKLASLGTLTAGIAHEIKNPLNFITNFADLSAELASEAKQAFAAASKNTSDLLQVGDFPSHIPLSIDSVEELQSILDDLEQNVNRITSHGKRADQIVQSMMLYTRGRASEYHTVSLHDVLDEYIGLAYHGLRAKEAAFSCTIQKSYDTSIQPMRLVPQDVGRVILNLVQNAGYALLKKAKQTNVAFEPTIFIRTTKQTTHVRLEIEDNGIGIPPEVLQSVFTPFFTTKPTGEGIGLGLSISYDIIVQQHAGEMKVYSEVNQYTKFVITLPTKQANTQ